MLQSAPGASCMAAPGNALLHKQSFNGARFTSLFRCLCGCVSRFADAHAPSATPGRCFSNATPWNTSCIEYHHYIPPTRPCMAYHTLAPVRSGVLLPLIVLRIAREEPPCTTHQWSDTSTGELPCMRALHLWRTVSRKPCHNLRTPL